MPMLTILFLSQNMPALLQLVPLPQSTAHTFRQKFGVPFYLKIGQFGRLGFRRRHQTLCPCQSMECGVLAGHEVISEDNSKKSNPILKFTSSLLSCLLAFEGTFPSAPASHAKAAAQHACFAFPCLTGDQADASAAETIPLAH